MPNENRRSSRQKQCMFVRPGGGMALLDAGTCGGLTKPGNSIWESNLEVYIRLFLEGCQRKEGSGDRRFCKTSSRDGEHASELKLCAEEGSKLLATCNAILGLDPLQTLITTVWESARKKLHRCRFHSKDRY